VKKDLSIAARFILFVLVVLVVCQGALWVWFLLNQKTSSAKMLDEKFSTAGDLLSGFSATAIAGDNYGALDQYMDTLARDEDVLAIRVMDKNGTVLREKTVRAETGERSIIPILIPWKNVSASEVKAGDVIAGRTEISYSGRRVNKSLMRLVTVWPLAQLAVFVLVGYVIYHVFVRAVARPVRIISGALGAVTSGDLTVTTPDLGDSEMGSITTGIRFLVERLSQTIERSNAVSGNVVIAVAQLTVALKHMRENALRQTALIGDVVNAVKAADKAQIEAGENAGGLSQSSSENVTSLLEMKATADEIASSTVRLFKTTESSYAMVAEMSQTAKEIAENAKEGFGAVEKTSASVEEINASLSEVLENTRRSAEFAADVRRLLTDSGTLAIADAVEAMEKIIDEVNHSAEIITRLRERSRSIEKVLSVIREVTESTNLLSLNAAILAAQAGEYGKSFSVVADEIRGLSDRTSSSAREIAGIVRTIQDEIGEAAGSIRMGVEKTEAGKELIFKAGEAIGETLEAAQKAAKMSQMIEKATHEQAIGLKQITVAMDSISGMIGHVAKATEEQGKGTSHMLDSISEVKEVAELVKRGTEEHAAGTMAISKNVEMTFDMAAKITRTSEEQQKINKDIVESAELMKKAGAETVQDMEELTASFNTLKKEIASLKREMGTFKVRAVPEEERA
jgi:methyl-accepting chemotaxis protein